MNFLERLLVTLTPYALQYTSLFTIMVANEKKTEKQTEQKPNQCHCECIK